MFVAKYTITNSILKNIGVIDAAREVVMSLPLVPAWEAKLKKEAMERMVHFGTHLEGNRLSEEEVRDVLDGRDVFAGERDIQEAVNYKNVLQFVGNMTSSISPGQPYLLTIETILEIQRLATEKTVGESSNGKLRVTQIVVRNTKTGEVSFTPPPGAEVPFLIEDLVNWVNSEETRTLHPVIKAGIIHFELSRVHPFIDGNGRTARALSMMVMALDGYGIGNLFCLEEYFAQNPVEYYVTIQSVANQRVLDTHERDITIWLEYFVLGVAAEFMKVKERVQRISSDSRVQDKLGERVELNERQMLIMEYLHRYKLMQNKDFRKIFPDYSDDTVLREIRFLKKKGLIKKTGGTKKAVYVLS